MDIGQIDQLRTSRRKALNRFLPLLDRLAYYKKEDLVGDLMAGVIVAIMLVPQGMAYAMLAGLPPQIGLYASIAPTILYGLLGTSSSLAVGPVALVSLMVAGVLGELAPLGGVQYMAMALALAFMVAVIQILLGLARLGSLVNFISHPVLSGFTSAAALIIGFSQIGHLTGMAMPRMSRLPQALIFTASHLNEVNPFTMAIGLGSILVLLYFKYGLKSGLKKLGVPSTWIAPISKSAPLVVVLLGIILVGGLGLDQSGGVQIVGQIPSGLPPITMPDMAPDRWQRLALTALAISLVGYLESISVAKSLASKRREKVDPNQELLALGAANLGAAFTGGYPVTGGFSRSVVNFSVGGRTGLASILTAVLVGATVVFLTPMFTYLPKAVLAAIIVVAVVSLVDVAALRHAWGYNKADAASLLVTFLAVLLVGIETGILVGVLLTLILYLWRTSQPHIAVVGRVGESQHFRNVLRHEVETHAEILAIRVDESLYFGNAHHLEEFLLGRISKQPGIKHILLVCSAVNAIDATALDSLENLAQSLTSAGISFNLAEVKGPVMDKLKKIDFIKTIGGEHVFLSTHEAVMELQRVHS